MNSDLTKSLSVPPPASVAPELLDGKFRSRGPSYVLQVGGATAYLSVALCLTEWLGNLAIVSAIAASAFLVFCLPAMPMSQPRRLLGGQIAALLGACRFPAARCS
jgi:CBS-domain-containing membrane protein